MQLVVHADDWPFTIEKLFGSKTVAMVKGQRHLDVRKMFLPAFSPKTNEQYIPRITEIAEELCALWAGAGEVKGEHAVKAFTGKVMKVASTCMHSALISWTTSVVSPSLAGSCVPACRLECRLTNSVVSWKSQQQCIMHAL